MKTPIGTMLRYPIFLVWWLCVSCGSDSDSNIETFEGDDPGECKDNADNDRNGLFDCDDPACEGSPACSKSNDTDPDESENASDEKDSKSTEKDDEPEQSTLGEEPESTDPKKSDIDKIETDTGEKESEPEVDSEPEQNTDTPSKDPTIETDAPSSDAPENSDTFENDTGVPPQGCDALDPQSETFTGADEPSSINVTTVSQWFSTPWGYDKTENENRDYPIVVNGCWGEGWAFTDDIRQQYPAFFLEYQSCDSDAQGADLADILDAAVDEGLRIDMNRVYLTGFSKGGSGSYKLVRGYLSKGKLFAAINRVAGQSEAVLPDEAVEKTAVWYHIGTDDTATRVDIANQAYETVKNHSYNEDAIETTYSDTLTGFDRTTYVLTRNDIDVMRLSVYQDMGHDPAAVYTDPEVFAWLFAQSLACR